MKYIVGAYATAPSLTIDDYALESEYYTSLIEGMNNIEGFEIPFWGDDIHRYGYDFLVKYLQSDWNNVLSCIPGSVTGLKTNIHFGLASDNPQGRKQALDMHKRASQVVKRINTNFGRNTIKAVELATAPSCPVEGVSSSEKSLRKSLEELLSWDWMGAKIVIEHCDTANNSGEFVKGFMDINQELEVLDVLKAKYNVGMTINWGRSVIEGKDPGVAIKHVRLAQEYNLLSGLMFSGTSSRDVKYGEWQDNHMPFAKSYNISHFENNSMLTKENVKNILSEVRLDKLDYLGVKLLTKSNNYSDVLNRVGVNIDACIVLDNIIDEIYVRARSA